MIETIMKDMIKSKLKLADTALSLLPDEIEKQIKDLGRTVLTAISEAAKEHLDENRDAGKGSSSNVRNISVE